MSGESANHPKIEEEEELQGRDYQIQLLNKAINENIILYLPTGSGKTFVAVMLIKSLSKDLERPYKEGGKRTFFAVNTVALVTQQGDYIARHTHLKVGKYSGDLNVDNWDAERWDSELRNNQVIVLTCQILLDMLSHGFVLLENINLIIFDECHHAVSDHCMRRVMQKFETCRKSLQPRVLGLSATLLNSNCKSDKVVREIKNLERTFQAKVATVDDLNLVKKFSTNPDERVVTFGEGYHHSVASCISSLTSAINSELQAALDIILSVKSSVFSSGEDVFVNVNGIKKLNETHGSREKKRLQSIVSDVKIMVKDLGVYGGNWAALIAIIVLHRRRLVVQTEYGKLVISGLITKMMTVRKIVYDAMKEYSPLDSIYKFSTSKVLKLIEKLKEYENDHSAESGVSLREKLEAKKNTQKYCSLIFVERRITAKTLYQILKNLAVSDPTLKYIVPEFVTGISSNPASSESALSNKRHHEAIKKFRNGECNFLVASDVMEEGVDIPQCTLVVKFDLPKTFRSYVQSKGRARHSTSLYVMLVPDTNVNFEKNLEEFRKVEEKLKQLLVGQTDSRKGPSEKEVNDLLYQQMLPPYYTEDRKASVNATSAVALIHRYCSMLPQDKFTQLNPLWLLDEFSVLESPSKSSQQNAVINKKRAYLQLPINSPLRSIVKGIPMANKRLAKRAVALVACVALHRMGELGKDDLLPIDHAPEVFDGSYLFPNWISEDSGEGLPGSKKRKRYYTKRVAEVLTGCHPKPGAVTYIHHIYQNPVYVKPSNDSRGIAIYNVLDMKRGFAILTSKELPEVCDFSIFMSSGEVAVSIGQDHQKTDTFNENQIKQLEDFHNMLFMDVLEILKSKQFVVVDKSNTGNSYIIAPTITDASGNWIIDWDVVGKFSKLPQVEQSKEEEMEGLIVNNDTFLYEVVTPWYRGPLTERHYVVTKICDDMDAGSPFPSTSYDSFEDYFDKKYGLPLFRPKLPLLEVKAISSRIDCIHPKLALPYDDTPRPMPLSKRQQQLKQGDFLEHLVPELVTQRKFPATLWLKATTLPTVLHRISFLQLAYELRSKISHEAKIGTVGPPVDGKWRRLEVEIKEVDEDIPGSKAIPSDFFAKDTPGPGQSLEPDPCDLDREIENLCLLDVIKYQKLEVQENCSEVPNHSEWQNIEPCTVPESVHNRIRDISDSEISTSCSMGPELADVLSAITGASASDVFNLERLETLGDSFLKFAASTFLYLKYPKVDEGKLTAIKGKIVSNRNLFYCAKKKNLGKKIKAHYFAPRSDWIPPGFTVPSLLKEKLDSHGGITNNVLFKLTIPEVDRITGQLSRETIYDIQDSLEENKNNNTIGKMSSTLEALLGRQSVPDKSLADCVEALIGAWLLSGGLSAALRLLGWFGIFPSGPNGPAGTWEELVGKEELDSVMDCMIKDQTDAGFIGGIVDWGPKYNKNDLESQVETTTSELLPQELDNNNRCCDENKSNSTDIENIHSTNNHHDRNIKANENEIKININESSNSDLVSNDSSMLIDEEYQSDDEEYQSDDEEYQSDDEEMLFTADIISDVESNESNVTLNYEDIEYCSEEDYSNVSILSESNHEDSIINSYDEWDDFEMSEENENVTLDDEPGVSYEMNDDIDYTVYDESSNSDCMDATNALQNAKHADNGRTKEESEYNEISPQNKELCGKVLGLRNGLEVGEKKETERLLQNQNKKKRKVLLSSLRPSKFLKKSSPHKKCRNSNDEQHENQRDKKILKYFQHYGKKERENMIKSIYKYASPNVMSNLGLTNDGLPACDIESLLPNANSIEETINYKFKNRRLLLQALTHASFHPNRITECYQRLEFLGDAVLDFVITCHIFETCGKLSPGELTDLRSALVNNITFASLVVRHGLHRHLLHLSPSLMDVLDVFVDFQLQRNNAVTEECLVLIEEDDCYLSESIEVPKALGDIMESLAGAIFLDSGLSLTTVWKVFYPIMKKEIDAFSKKVPKQPVRELLECTNVEINFLQSQPVQPEIKGEEANQSNLTKKVVMVPVEVREKATGKCRTFYGFGERKSLAKRAAAKLALRAMRKFSMPKIPNQSLVEALIS